jgi:hypothetical protein
MDDRTSEALFVRASNVHVSGVFSSIFPVDEVSHVPFGVLWREFDANLKKENVYV